MPGPFRRRIGVRKTPVVGEKTRPRAKSSPQALKASRSQTAYAALKASLFHVSHDFATLSATCYGGAVPKTARARVLPQPASVVCRNLRTKSPSSAVDVQRDRMLRARYIGLSLRSR